MSWRQSRLWRVLLESIPAEFPSAFGLEESLQRLTAACSVPWRRRTWQPSLLGQVSAQSVVLRRSGSLRHRRSYFRFYGAFAEDDKGVVLRGRFAAPGAMKVWAAAFYGIGLGVAVFGLGVLVGGDAVGLWALCGASAWLAVTLGLLLGQARTEERWLRAAIRSVLSAADPPASASSEGPQVGWSEDPRRLRPS